MTTIHIKDAPSLDTECLTHALCRLTCLDHYFSNNSRDYLIKKIKNINELHLPHSLPIFLNMGLCGQIDDRLYRSGFHTPDVEMFTTFLNWRFFDNANYPIRCDLSDFSREVRENMAKRYSLLSKFTKKHYDEHPEHFVYYWHQIDECTDHFPLMQYDSESPYGAKRLKLLKEMIKTLTEIRSYAVKVEEEGDYKYPVIGSVIAPNQLIK